MQGSTANAVKNSKPKSKILQTSGEARLLQMEGAYSPC